MVRFYSWGCKDVHSGGPRACGVSCHFVLIAWACESLALSLLAIVTWWLQVCRIERPACVGTILAAADAITRLAQDATWTMSVKSCACPAKFRQHFGPAANPRCRAVRDRCGLFVDGSLCSLVSLICHWQHTPAIYHFSTVAMAHWNEVGLSF